MENNNNTKTAARPTLTGDECSIIGEDEPLLFASMLDQNNNNPAANCAITNVIPDSLDPRRNFSLKMKNVGNEDVEYISVTTSLVHEISDDGRLLFWFFLNNQNNNKGIRPCQKNVQSCLDILYPTNIALGPKFPGKDANDDMDNITSTVIGVGDK